MADIASSQLWADLQTYADKRIERYRSKMENFRLSDHELRFYQGKLSELKRLKFARNITEIFDDNED